MLKYLIAILAIVTATGIFAAEDTLLIKRTMEANAFFHAGEHKEAIRKLDEIISAHPDNFNARLKRALSLSYTGNDSAAIDDFTSALALTHYEKALVHFHRAYSYFMLKRFKAALDDYDMAIALKKDYHEAYNNKALVEERTGRLTEALNDYLSAVRLDTSFAEYQYNAGRLYYAKDSIDKAKEYLLRTISLDKGHLAAMMLLGDIFVFEKDYSNAMAQYSRAIEAAPGYADAYLKRGYCRMNYSLFPEACEDFRISLKFGNKKAEELIRKVCGDMK